MTQAIQIGRLLRAGTPGFVVGCRVTQLDTPSFGALVKAPVSADYEIYGLIYDIHIDDDGLVRQLVTAEGVDESVINDNRVNRNVPLEMSVLAVGYRQGGQIYHLLPPRPPLSLDVIYLCDPRGAAPVHLRRAIWLLPPRAARSGSAGGRAAGGARPAGAAGSRCRRRPILGQPGDPGADHPAAR